jgi:hypothetical protein
MRLARSYGLLLLLCITMVSACGGGAVSLGPEFAAGIYRLEAVAGRGSATGIVFLSADGTAERRVQYAQPSGGLSAEYVARGNFQLGPDGAIDLQLREDDGRSSYVWRPRATLNGSVLQLQYPDPADGPDIVERYRRW